MGTDMRLDGKQFSQPTFYVDSEPDLLSAVDELRRSKRLGVDTESNSLFAFKEQVCTIQISSSRANYIFDTIRLNHLDPLSEIFSDSKIEKIFHGADYDVGLLKRDFGYDCRPLFDTMVAAQFLNCEKIGMADLVERYFTIRLEKKFTKSDWKQRPLSIEQIVYLCQDSQYLIDLRECLFAALEQRDLVEEAFIEFRHLEDRPPLEPAYENMTLWDIKGAKALDASELPVLFELFQWRQQRARKINLPPFKIMNNSTLIELAKLKPHNKQEIFTIKGITTNVWQRHGQHLLNAINRGERRPESKVPPPNKNHRHEGRKPVHWNDQELVDRLRKWRIATAEKRGIHHLAVIPGYALEEIARKRPASLEAIIDIAGVGKKRASLYGPEIIEIIRSIPSSR